MTEQDRDNSEQQRAAKVDHDVLVDLTWWSMRDNLLFYSIPEAANDDDCEATVQTFFKNELGITEDIGLERVHRMARRVDGKCRPIVDKFSSYKQREVVRLAGEQILKEWQDRHKAHLPAFKDAKKKGKRASFVGDKLLVEGHFVGDKLLVEGHFVGDKLLVEGHFVGDKLLVEGHFVGDKLLVEGHFVTPNTSQRA